MHTCIKPTLKYIRQFGKCQSQVDFGNSRFKFPARWAGETPDDYSISDIPFSGRQVCVHMHIDTYIISIWEKNKVTFWMKSAAFTSKPHGLWRKECYNITDPSRQPFPPLAPPIPTQMLESYSPTGESSLSYSLSILVMAFPHSAFSSLFHSSGTWPRQLSGL